MKHALVLYNLHNLMYHTILIYFEIIQAIKVLINNKRATIQINMKQ